MTFATRLTTKAPGLGCLCVIALMGVGCSDVGGIATAPSVTSGIGSGAAVTIVTQSRSAAATAGGALPFRGSLEGTDTDSVAFPILSVHLTGTGDATLLGAYTATFDFRVDLRAPTSPAIGSFTLTSANGDSVIGDLVGRASIANGIATVVETATITRGTGRFTAATGTFTVTRTVVQATGITTGSFDGALDLHG